MAHTKAIYYDPAGGYRQIGVTKDLGVDTGYGFVIDDGGAAPVKLDNITGLDLSGAAGVDVKLSSTGVIQIGSLSLSATTSGILKWDGAKIQTAKVNDFQEDVLDVQTDATLDPGATPTAGDRYILTNVAALHANFGSITGVGNNDVVEYVSAAFVVAYDVSAQGEGAFLWDRTANVFKKYDGSTWGEFTAGAGVSGDGTGVTDAAAFRAAIGAGTGDGTVTGDGTGVTDSSAFRTALGLGIAYVPSSTGILTDWDPHLGASISSIPCVDGDNIDLVTDQSAGAHNATQTTAANRPQFRSNTLNGYSVAEFVAGGADFMTFGTGMGRPADYTEYAIMWTRSTSSQYVLGSIDSLGTSAKSWGWLNLNVSSGKAFTVFGDDSVQSRTDTSNTEIEQRKWFAIAIQHTNGEDHSHIYINGKAPAYTKTSSNTTLSTGIAQNFSIGRVGDVTGTYFDGMIARFIAYSAAHDATTIRTILTGLALQYGLTTQ